MKSIWFAYAMVWLSVAIAVSVGIYFTRNIHCLWFLVVPLFVSMEHNKKDKDNKKQD